MKSSFKFVCNRCLHIALNYSISNLILSLSVLLDVTFFVDIKISLRILMSPDLLYRPSYANYRTGVSLQLLLQLEACEILLHKPAVAVANNDDRILDVTAASELHNENGPLCQDLQDISSCPGK